MIEPPTQPTQPTPDIIEITDVNQFVGILAAWHSKKVAVLEHMLQVPEGTEMSVDGQDPLILTGDMLAGVKAGISIALMELGSLPFIAETEPVAIADESVQAKLFADH